MRKVRKNPDNDGKIGFWAVFAIGVGGMVGGGIFAVLGLSVELAGGGTPVAFAVAGVVALVTSYSYAKLSVTYPCQGGTVEFLNQAFGTGLITGGLNTLLLLSYVVMLSLYSYAFGSYGASFFHESAQPLVKHIFISGVIILFTMLNVLGATVVGKAEKWVVGLKLLILLFFVAIGLWSVSGLRLAPGTWTAPVQLVAGGMIIFVAYEGFELISNTAADVRNPRKILPAAYFSAVGFVIILYILVSIVTVGNLALSKIAATRDYALAEAAKPFLGEFGFSLIAVAALLSTSSAVNATLYGSARISYIVAKEGQLPRVLEKKVWDRPVEGLLIVAGITLLVGNLFDVSSISTMGSAGFLLIFAAVNYANFRLYKRTGANRVLAAVGAVVCTGALGALVWETLRTAPANVWVLVVMGALAFTIEGFYRAITGREIRPVFKRGNSTG